MATLLQQFAASKSATGKFDLTKATMEQKLKFLEELIKQYGEGNAHIIVTSKNDLDKISLHADASGADVMA